MHVCSEQSHRFHTSTEEGNGSVDSGGDHGSAAKGSAIDLEVAGSGPVSCHFFIPFSFLPYMSYRSTSHSSTHIHT